MCRSIGSLRDVASEATTQEAHAGALQHVQEVSGMTEPSQANIEAFERATVEFAHAAEHLPADVVTSASPRGREV